MRLKELAELLEGECRGEGDLEVTSLERCMSAPIKSLFSG